MPNISKAQELRRLNGELHGKMTAMLTKAADEKRDLAAEEREEWDRMDVEYAARLGDIERHEKDEKREEHMNALNPRRAGREAASANPEDEQRDAQRRALRAFISQEPNQWEPEMRQLIRSCQEGIPAEARNLGQGFVMQGRRDLLRTERDLRERGLETRALTAAANATVAEEFMRELDVALLDYAGIAQAARIIETETGADMPWPTIDDTGNSGHLLAELSAAATNVDPTLAAVTFGSWLYTSDIVLIPNQLIQDAAFSIETEIARLLGVRLGKILNTDGTLGDGSSKPRGIVTALMADVTPVVPVSATALSYLDLVEVMHAVDPAYRNQPKVAWMFHDQILMVLKQMLDDANRPIWAGGIAVREPDTILGKPYFINQAMDSTIAEDKETVIFGDFSKYIIRRVLNPILIRLNERYAEYYQTGFVMFDRWDSDLVNGAANPLQIITHNLA